MSKSLAAVPMPFIVSVPRSGTTLLGMMLDTHPDIAISPKTRFIPQLVTACRNSPTPRETFVALVTSPAVNQAWSDWQIADTDLQQAVSALYPFNLTAALRTLYGLLAQRDGKARYGDKTAGNLTAMRVIQGVLPEAHFIHLVRDGRGQWLSERQTAWGSQSVARGALRWATQITWAWRMKKTIAHYLEIRYEDLVVAPKATLQQICNFIALPWDDSMLDYTAHATQRLSERQDTPDFSAAYRRQLHTHVTKAPDPTRIATWEMALTPAEIAQFEHLAGDVLLTAGYTLRSKANPRFCRFYRLQASMMRRLKERLKYRGT